MKKELENYLWNEIPTFENDEVRNSQFARSTRDVILEMIGRGWIKSEKQALRTLEKWTDKRKYEYGSRIDLGWKR